MRLSINASGQVRVGMPYWTPYEAGLVFIKSKKSWIQQQLVTHAPSELRNGSRIGKAHRLIFYRSNSSNGLANVRITATTIEIRTSLDPSDARVQNRALKACEEALKMEAKQLLPIRVKAISSKNQLEYNDLKIRKLTSRWGSCSTNKVISLSYFLIQLPWELIDYVILHELAHTRFLNHSRDFWEFMERNLPNVRELRKLIKDHKPRVEVL